MKCFILLIAGALLGSALFVCADEGRTINFITTKSGKTYQHCRVFKLDPDGVLFAHQNGAAKILFSDMNDAMRNSLGYDPAKAAAYDNSLAEKRKQERERQAEYRSLIVKAQITAAELEIKRLQVTGDAAYANGGYNSGTLDYTAVWPWSNQFGHGYFLKRSCFQAGGPGHSIDGGRASSLFRAAPSHSVGASSRQTLGVPALSGFAPPLAARPAQSSAR